MSDHAHPEAAPLAAPAVISISAAGDGSVWVLDKSGRLLRGSGDGWVPAGLDLPLSQIAARDAAAIWALDSAGSLYELTDGAGGWAFSPQHVSLAWISVAADGALWGADLQGDLVRFDPGGKTWETAGRPEADGPVAQVSAAGGETALVLCDTGHLYRWADGRFEPASGSLPVGVASVSALSGGPAAYAVGTDHRLYLGLDEWLPAGGPVVQVSAAAPWDAWCIDPDGHPVHAVNPAHAGEVEQQAAAPRWDAQSVFDENESTHLWMVNRAAGLTVSYGQLGTDLFNLVKPGKGRLGDPFHDMLCQGLYDADWKAPYDDRFNGIPTWESHFYDPATGLNYRGHDAPTALTRGAELFEASLLAYWAGKMADAGYYLGLSLHYLTDVTQPMHAGNFTWLSSYFLGYHSDFERYVMEIQSTVAPPDVYQPSGLGTNPRRYIIAAAERAKTYLEYLTPPWVQSVYETMDKNQEGHRVDLKERAQRDLPHIMSDGIMITAQYLIAWMTAASSRFPWERWTRAGRNSRVAAPGAPLTMVQNGPQRMDLFVTDSSGVVRTLTWANGSFPQDWQTVPGRRMAAGAPVEAVWREPMHLDVFATDNNGTPCSAFWEPKAGWRDWFPIGPSETLAAGTPITALWAPRPGHLDLFAPGPTGMVLTAYWQEGRPSWTWVPTNTKTPRANGNAKVAAVWRDSGHLDLFTTSRFSVITSWWEPASGWQPWNDVPTPNEISVGTDASVTAVWRPGSSPMHLDLFVSGWRGGGRGGAVYTTYWTPSQWAYWATIRDKPELSSAAPVTALWHDYQLYLFTSSATPTADGGAWITSWPETAVGWELWKAVGADSINVTPDGAVPAAWARSGQLFAFAAGQDGAVYYTSCQPLA
jgi:hypothetical protein